MNNVMVKALATWTLVKDRLQQAGRRDEGLNTLETVILASVAVVIALALALALRAVFDAKIDAVKAT